MRSKVFEANRNPERIAALEVENDRLRSAMREARALLHEIRPQSMRAAMVLSRALDPIADVDPSAHSEVAEMRRRPPAAPCEEREPEVER